MSRKSTVIMVNMEINSHRSKIHIISLYKLTFVVETNWRKDSNTSLESSNTTSRGKKAKYNLQTLVFLCRSVSCSTAACKKQQ